MVAGNESRGQHTGAPEDAPLRADVRWLGALVGEVIAEQGGQAFFDHVEGVRRAAIGRRRGDADADSNLRERLHALDAEEAGELVRAFATYFQVVNLAEEVHRIRRLRERQRAGESPEMEGLVEAFERLRAAGFDRGRVHSLLSGILIEPVFTAHPTEATRRTILEKQQRIVRALTDRLDPSMTPAEDRATRGVIRTEVTSAWQTEEHPGQRPTVRDELEHVLFYLTDIIYRIVPPFYEEVEAALEHVHGEGAGPVPSLLRFASWVGGDMDGNPNVSADTLRNALAEQRRSILQRYRAEFGPLARRLSQSLSRVAVDDGVLELVDRYRRMFPAAYDRIPPRHRNMPYRELCQLIPARLAATINDDEGAYRSPAEFLDDIRLMADSLKRNGGEHAGAFQVDRLLRRAETFGFHLATVDVRQDAAVHREVMGACLGDPAWSERDRDERTATLEQALADGRQPESEALADESVERVLEVFRAIRELRERYGARAIGCYIVSMTQGRDDLLTVLLLARWAGLADGNDRVDLDVAPLFETVGDLEAAPEVMDQMLSDPRYRAHLEGRGDRQVVMVGYSDSSKDGGLVASRWALQCAQATLVEIAERHRVDPIFFHGRGGTTSRGGGRIHRAILSAPRGSVRGRLRVTEQGEVIHTKYGVRSQALRTLETSLAPVLQATGAPRAEDEREPRWVEMMAEIARASRDAYRGLVYDDPRFFEYFRAATPIDVIERMAIGSRPASRRAGQSIANLRAIPWVFAWTQSRQILPGWYGLGSGLQFAIDRWGEADVAIMLRDWPFLANVVNDTEMVLAKVDLGIGSYYAELAGEQGQPVFGRIREEYERAVRLILRLKGNEQLLDDERGLQRSIGLRNPYMDPMSLVQVELLARWRAADRPEGPLFQALLATVNGLAHGMQQSG